MASSVQEVEHRRLRALWPLGFVVAVVLSAVFSRLLSADLTSPAWAAIGSVVLAAGALWWWVRCTERRPRPWIVALTVACTGAAAWLAWSPPPEPGFVRFISAKHDEASAAAQAILAETSEPRGCEQAAAVELGVLEQAGSWQNVCWNRQSPHAGLTLTAHDNVDPGNESLGLTYAPSQTHLPPRSRSCVKQIGDWWAFMPPTDGMYPQCLSGFQYTGGY